MNTTLYVINGPSAAGKSHLMRFVENRFDGTRAIAKLTTRPRRPAEAAATWSDLIHVTDGRFEELAPEYRYTWNGYRYGIGRAELMDRLDGARAGLIVVRDVPTIRKLSLELSPVVAIPVLVTADPAIRKRRLLAEGLDESEVDLRLAREREADEVAPDDGIYRWRLTNEGSPEAFHREISRMIASTVDSG